MTVYLVGAGPGDPELLTVKAARLISQADVVVYDRLMAPEVLDMARPDAERINVGKRPGLVMKTQEETNAILVEHGQAGRLVVRVKGGDPFVFGRGGEEALALTAAGVPFEVVPGISSAIAAPAAAGIPVTMRHEGLAFTVVTGHEDPTSGIVVDWRALAATNITLVVMMGVGRIEQIAAELVAGGRSPDTPLAAVRWAWTDRQVVTRTTLDEVGNADLQAPSTIIIGPLANYDL